MEADMKKCLIVYFSRTGYTRKVADKLAGRCNAEIESIEDTGSRSGMRGYLRSAYEALRKRHIEIQPVPADPAEYDLVILGTPVWAGHVCSPMRAYISAQRARFPQLAFFCTQGGSGADKVFREMAELCARQPIATVALNDSEIDAGDSGHKLDDLIRAACAEAAA
jgi:flavodoxin